MFNNFIYISPFLLIYPSIFTLYYYQILSDKTLLFIITKSCALMTITTLSLSILSLFEGLNIVYSQRKQYHMFFVNTTLFFSIIHAIIHIYLVEKGNVFKTGYVTGIILSFLFIILFTGTTYKIRKYYYHYFYLIHTLLIFLIIIISIIHSILFLYITILILIYITYKFIFKRHVITACSVNSINSSYVNIHLLYPSKINKLTDIQHGDYAYIRCKNLNGYFKYEKHPFTVVNIKCLNETLQLPQIYSDIINPKTKQQVAIDIIISTNGNWCSRLNNFILSNRDYELTNNGLDIEILGIFKGSLRHVFKCNNVIFIITGIGITSFLAYLNYLNDPINQILKRNISLYWNVKSANILKLLDVIESFKLNKRKDISFNISIYTQAYLIDTFNKKPDNNNINFFTSSIPIKKIFKDIKETAVFFSGNSDEKRNLLKYTKGINVYYD